MLKFKRLNVLTKVRETGESYSLHNLIRQTTLQYILDEVGHLNKEDFIKATLKIIEEDLKIMIIEKEQTK